MKMKTALSAIFISSSNGCYLVVALPTAVTVMLLPPLVCTVSAPVVDRRSPSRTIACAIFAEARFFRNARPLADMFTLVMQLQVNVYYG